MDPRYFVDVIAPDHRRLLDLRDHGLDLFKPTAAVGEQGAHVIEGLLTLAQIGRLADEGYQVLVKAHERTRSRAAHETSSFQDWLKTLEE